MEARNFGRAKWALVIPVTGEVRMTSLPGVTGEGDFLRAQVGGFFQVIEVRLDWKETFLDVCLWCNEDGKFMGLPYNPRADALAHASTSRYSIADDDFVVGPVVVTGCADNIGGTQSLSKYDIRFLLEWIKQV